MSTLSTMRTNVRADLSIDPNGDIWTDGDIDRYINEFVGVVYSWTGLDFAESTANLTLVAGTATYALTALANYGKFTSVRLTGRYELLEERTLPYLENTVDLTYQGEPVYFYLYGDDTIGFWPTPDAVIGTASVRYERSSPTLTSSDEPAFDSQWHHVCEKYALWSCFSNKPGFESRAAQAWEVFKPLRSQMKDDVWERTTDTRSIKNEITPLWPA